MAKRDALPKTDTTLQSRLGVLVKNFRRRLGITQEELAWRADMHRSYVADIERGGRNMTLRSIMSLAAALEIPVQSLFSQLKVPDMIGEVLLAEDSEADAMLTLRALRGARVSNPIKVVHDGEEAWEYLSAVGRQATRKGARLPQLVLLDLKLPGLSGLDLLRRLKSDPRTQAIPVVILTGSRSDRDIIECSRLGAANYIIKPVSFAGLCDVTARLGLSWMLVDDTMPRGRAAGGSGSETGRAHAAAGARKKVAGSG